MSSDSLHAGKTPLVPYSPNLRALNKSYSTLEMILAHCVLCAILLPTAAQSLLSAIFVILFIRRGGLATLKGNWLELFEPKVASGWSILMTGLLGLWFCQFGSMLIELIQLNKAETVVPVLLAHLRLIGKQGLYGYFVIMSFLVGTVVSKKQSLRANFFDYRYPFYFSLILTLYMLGQRNFGWDWVHGFGMRIGEHRFAYGAYRASGFMGHPLSMAYNSMMFGLLALAHGFWLLRKKSQDAFGWFVITFLMIIEILLTGSRYPLALGLFLGILLSIYLMKFQLHKNKMKISSVIILFILLVSLFITTDLNFRGRWTELFDSHKNIEVNFDRLIFWKVNLNLAFDYFWSGTGLINYPSLLLDYYNDAGYTHIERKYPAHNIFIQTFADMGLLGCAGLFCLFQSLLRISIKFWKLCHHTGLASLTLATLVGGLLQNNLRDSEFLFALWVTIGLTLSWLVEQGMASESKTT